MNRAVFLVPFLCLAACDSSSSENTTDNGAETHTVAKTLKVDDDELTPIVGGWHEPKYKDDSIPQTTLNFIGSIDGGARKYNGGLLVSHIAEGASYSLDTAYFAFRKPGANLSFFRYATGVDSCYYSSMSGTLVVTGWKSTTLNGKPGHLASAHLEATMGFPWPMRNRVSCPESLPVRMEFTEAFIMDDAG